MQKYEYKTQINEHNMNLENDSFILYIQETSINPVQRGWYPICGSDLLLLAIALFLHLVYDQLRITFQPFVRQLLLSILELLVGMFAYVAAQDIPRDAFFPWET